MVSEAFDPRFQFVNTMSLDFKLILDEFNRRFDELEIRWDRRFSSAAYIDLPRTSLSINHSSDAFASAPPTPVAVIADNWGGCFDDGEQYRTRPSVVVDNWGGFFCGEDVAPSDNPTRFVLPVASPDEPSIDTAPTRANSGAADDSMFVTDEPSGYDEIDARLDLRFARLQQLQAEEVDEPYRDAVSPLPPLPVVYEPYREASHPPPVHDDDAGVVSTGSDDNLDLQQIAKESSVSSPPRHSSRDAVRGPCPRPLHHQLTIPVAANLDQICRLSRPCDVAGRGLLCDLLWSDPSSMEDREWADNKDRYVSCTFGADVATDCRRAQDLDIVCRAHQVMEDEYEFSVDCQLVTFFSAPNYRKLGCSFTIIKPKADRNSSSPLGCSTKCLVHAASTPMSLSMPDAVPTQYPTSPPHVFTISNHEISSFVIPVHDSTSEHQVVNQRASPEISVLAFLYNAEAMLLSSLASIALGPPTASLITSISASCVTISLGAHHSFDEMSKGSWCLPQLRHQHYGPGNVWKFLHSYSSCIIDYHGTKHNNVFRRALVWCCKLYVHELLGHFEYLLLDITKEHTIICINSSGLERTFILWLSWPTPVKIVHASGELRPRSWPSLYCHQSIVAFGFDESTYIRDCQYYICLLKSPWPPPLKQNFKYMYAKLSKIMLAMAMSLKCAHTPVVAGQMYIQRSRCMVDCFHRDQISKCWKHQFELAESAFQLNLWFEFELHGTQQKPPWSAFQLNLWFEFELHGTQQKPPWLSIVHSLLFLLKLLCIQLNCPIDTLVEIKDSGSSEIPVLGLSFRWSGKALITSILIEWVVLKHLDLLHKNYHIDCIFMFTDYTLNRAATIFGSKRINEAIFSATQTHINIKLAQLGVLGALEIIDAARKSYTAPMIRGMSRPRPWPNFAPPLIPSQGYCSVVWQSDHNSRCVKFPYVGRCSAESQCFQFKALQYVLLHSWHQDLGYVQFLLRLGGKSNFKEGRM